MTATGLIVSLVLLAIAVIGVALPFLQQRRNQNRELATALSQIKRDELLTDYERVLATIRDLDEDHQTGKLAPDTYQRERAYWTEQGILLLQKLEPDAEALSDETTTDSAGDSDTLDDAVERAIAEYRRAQA
jgi:hypothetical protein